MSRRFGRNQRRRLREQLAQAERFSECAAFEATTAQAQLRAQVRQNEELQGQIDQVKRTLGEHYIGLSPSRFMVALEALYDDELDRFRVTMNGRHLEASALMVSAHGDRLQDNIHFIASLAGGRVAYAVSYRSITHSPIGPFAWGLAKQMAPLLAEEARAVITGERRHG